MKKNFSLIALLFSISTYLFTGCANNNSEKLFPKAGNCDTVAVSYKNEVEPILKNNCITCHSGNSPSAGKLLDTYESVVRTADSGRILGAINHASGYAPMPGTKMNDCNIQLITAWIRQGKPNN